VAHGTLHNRPQRSEITAFCRRLWLCAAAALDETNDRTDNSRTGDWFTTGLVTDPSQSDRQQSSISTKIGAFSSHSQSA